MPWIKVNERQLIQLSSSAASAEDIWLWRRLRFFQRNPKQCRNNRGINQQRFTEEPLFSGANEDKQRSFG